MGRYLEDFRAGELIKHWPGRTIRDFDDTWFTLMTMNTNPLHFDEHFASQSQHGRCLVNGTLVFAIAVGMSVRDVSENAIANLEYEKVLHHAPTYHGDTIYAESEYPRGDTVRHQAGSGRRLPRDPRAQSARRGGPVAPAARADPAPPGLRVRAQPRASTASTSSAIVSISSAVAISSRPVRPPARR